jgi:hypothetical protein
VRRSHVCPRAGEEHAEQPRARRVVVDDKNRDAGQPLDVGHAARRRPVLSRRRGSGVAVASGAFELADGRKVDRHAAGYCENRARTTAVWKRLFRPDFDELRW